MTYPPASSRDSGVTYHEHMATELPDASNPNTIDLTGLPPSVVVEIQRLVREARQKQAEESADSTPDQRPPLLGRFAHLALSFPKEELDEGQREAATPACSSATIRSACCTSPASPSSNDSKLAERKLLLLPVRICSPHGLPAHPRHRVLNRTARSGRCSKGQPGRP